MISPAPAALMSEVLITTISARHGIGTDGTSGMSISVPVSAAWPSANFALYFPLYMDRPGLVTKFWTLNGAAASGNMDIGLYRKDYTLISSAGSTAQAGTNVIQAYDVTDFWITRGVYFLGLVNSGTTGTVFRTGLGAAAFGQVMGITQQGTALPLPSTATPVLSTTTFPVPVAGIAFRALVA